MHSRTAFAPGLVIGLVCLIPTTVFGQAFITPRGEVILTTNYQWFDSNEHLLTAAVTGPERTPLETSLGLDFPTKVADDVFPQGRTTTQMMFIDADVGITDRLALMGGVALGASRYIGPVPTAVTDDSHWHPSFQDLRIGVRFLAIDAGATLVTPFATVQFPLADYPIIGHTALGLGLNELEVGASVGRILSFGDQLAYVEGRYSYAFVENVQVENRGEVAIDRSRLVAEVDYFWGPVALQFTATWRHVHGGVDPVQIGGNPHLIGFHGQELTSRDFRLGGGISFPITDSVGLYASYNDLTWGELVDNANIFSVGFDWNFQLFGGLGSGLLLGDD